MTEEQFKDILANESVPKIIQEPGKAEMYLKTAEDWEGVRTSKSSLEEAIRNGNIPVDVNDESYILLEYDKDKIMDEHENKEEAGYGKIDDEDIHGVSDNDAGSECREEERELEEEANRQDETGTLWDRIRTEIRGGMRVVAARQALEVSRQMIGLAGHGAGLAVEGGRLVAEVIGEVAEAGREAFQRVSAGMGYDIENPDPETADKGEPEIDNPDVEPIPGGRRPY